MIDTLRLTAEEAAGLVERGEASAAAVAGGLAPWALGSDTGGSVKQPAALCGVVGLRPTYGTVSRYGIVAFASSLDQIGPITKTVRDEPKRRIMLGTYALSAGYYEAYYGQAQRVRTLIAQEHAALFERYDVLVSPTSPTVAFRLGERTENPLAMYLSDVLTIPSNMAGLPGLSIPCGLSDGLPIGLQLVGPQFSENELFRAGHALERALAFDYVPERLR